MPLKLMQNRRIQTMVKQHKLIPISPFFLRLFPFQKAHFPRTQAVVIKAAKHSPHIQREEENSFGRAICHIKNEEI